MSRTAKETVLLILLWSGIYVFIELVAAAESKY